MISLSEGEVGLGNGSRPIGMKLEVSSNSLQDSVSAIWKGDDGKEARKG
jgi:hypothetical protein